MTVTSQGTSVPRDQIEANRERGAVVMRVIADLHAAYGRGVSIDITAPLQGPATLRMSATGANAVACFWDDGEVTVAQTGHQHLSTYALEALAILREFIHRHGRGAR